MTWFPCFCDVSIGDFPPQYQDVGKAQTSFENFENCNMAGMMVFWSGCFKIERVDRAPNFGDACNSVNQTALYFLWISDASKELYGIWQCHWRLLLTQWCMYAWPAWFHCCTCWRMLYRHPILLFLVLLALLYERLLSLFKLAFLAWTSKRTDFS